MNHPGVRDLLLSSDAISVFLGSGIKIILTDNCGDSATITDQIMLKFPLQS